MQPASDLARSAQHVAPPLVEGDAAVRPRARNLLEQMPIDDQADARQTLSTDSNERRQGVRRDITQARAFQPPKAIKVSKDWLPQRWNYLIAVMLICVAGCFFASGTTPDLVANVLITTALVSIVPISATRGFADRLSGKTKITYCIVAVALPMFLFGLGLSRWAIIGGLPWNYAVVCLISVSAIAAVYVRQRPALIFAVQIGTWLAVTLSNMSVAGFIALAVCLVLAVLISRDQFELQRTENENRMARERAQTRARDILADYEETGQGWFWETDRRSQLTYVSSPVAKLIGIDPEEIIGQGLTKLFDMEESGAESERSLQFHLSARSSFAELDMRAATDSEVRWWSVSGRPIYDQFDNFVGFRGSGTDLTERRRSQENASRLAHFDSLTDLANRFQMSQSLEKILKSPQVDNRDCAVMLLDLDRFKHVNDTLGHPAGDALLKQVSQRLERAVGKIGQVGRLGGDEFKVIVPSRQKRNDLGNLAEAIIHALSQPYSIDGQRVVIGASIGIALSPDDGVTSEELIRNSDLALYAAKDGGRGRFHFYSDDLHEVAEKRAQLEEELRDAISNGDLELHYQPVVSTATEKITGFEALMRWHHPVKGWISPDKFINIAEESGLINQMGEWALRQACQDISEWSEDVRVAVNVSPLQFSNPQLPAVVTSAIASAGIAPSRLELEITESVFLSDDEGTDAMFAALKRVGVRLALDDFGTGYSSLGYLKKAPFDKIKIDQSFVRGATVEGSRNGAIIASITSLAHALGMDTTAEGVETLDELDLVRLHGCSHVQGYIYERPLTAADASKRLETGLAAVARGPRSARAPRQKMLRKVVLDHQGQRYNGTIRNISTSGALIEGLYNVPVGTEFSVQISKEHAVSCTTRWCEKDQMGVQFKTPLRRDGAGRLTVMQTAAPTQLSEDELRKAG